MFRNSETHWHTQMFLLQELTNTKGGKHWRRDWLFPPLRMWSNVNFTARTEHRPPRLVLTRQLTISNTPTSVFVPGILRAIPSAQSHLSELRGTAAVESLSPHGRRLSFVFRFHPLWSRNWRNPLGLCLFGYLFCFVVGSFLPLRRFWKLYLMKFMPL